MAPGASRPRGQTKGVGATTTNPRLRIWRNSGRSYFASINGGARPTKMFNGPSRSWSGGESRRSASLPRSYRRKQKENTQRPRRTLRDGGTNSEGQVKYWRCTFFGHATPDLAGARPYRVQCRVGRCDIGLLAHTSHPLFASFAAPIP